MLDNSRVLFPLFRLSGVVILAALVFLVFRPFLNALIWVSVISVMVWPFNRFLRRMIPRHGEATAAGILTFLLVFLTLLLIAPLFLRLLEETKQLGSVLRAWANDERRMPPMWLEAFPWLQDYFGMLFENAASGKETISRLLEEFHPQILSVVTFAARSVGEVLFNFVAMIFSTYFFFRYGDVFCRRILTAAERIAGEHYVDLVLTSWGTVRAVVFGVVGAAITQGSLAGIGYYACGVPLPLLFALLTTVLGLVPIGPPIVYLSLSFYLFVGDAHWHAAALAIWGIVVVSSVDNIVRMFLISQTTNLPILLAFIGGVGGIAAFGMIGLFVGPVALALAYNFWLAICSEVRGPSSEGTPL